MVAQSGERIGIVVIHGVGETNEGWIDSYLVPELEQWTAHHNLDARASSACDSEMVLVVRAADRHVAIVLDTDERFAAFCATAGLATLPAAAEFCSPHLRKLNRDALADAIAPTVVQHPANAWLEHLAAARVPAAIAFSPTSEVHHVRDPESSDPIRTWKSFTRRWPLDGREVLVTELFWADMSKAGTSILARLLAIFELILESPFVLGRSLLSDSARGIHRVIRMLTATANWLMRWPIAGLNVAVFLTALVAVIVKEQDQMQWLPHFVAGSLAVITIGGYVLFHNWLHKRPGLADLALSAAISAIFLAGLLALLAYGDPAPLPITADYYLVRGVVLLYLVWTLWSVAIDLALLCVTLVGAKRLFFARRPIAPPLARPAAAIALNLVLAMLLKFFFASFGMVAVLALVPDRACPGGVPRAGPLWDHGLAWQTTSDACKLDLVKDLLINVGAFNALAIALVLIAIVLLRTIRLAKARLFRKSAIDGTLRLPRLIASPLIIAVLFAGALLNTAIFYIPAVAEMQIPKTVMQAIRDSGLQHFGAGGLLLIILILGRFVEMSHSVVHIGRDLVDHQYDRDPKSLAMRLTSLRGWRARAKSAAQQRYRRRMRIQRRLEALIEDVIARQGIDRLVFLAHSQGTVILRDYLLDHDQLIADKREQLNSLSKVRRIDVITLGSPLSHIYKHYFRDYDRLPKNDYASDALIGKIKSWTNVWRIDDPIGHAVDLHPVLQVENRGIGPGGHTFYWKEPLVCAKLWELVAASEAAAPARGVELKVAARR